MQAWHCFASRPIGGLHRPMPSEPESITIRSGQDVVKVRQTVRSRAMDLGFSLVEQTKIVTAASELARNTLAHGGGGEARLEQLLDGGKRGLRLTFEDRGPGIANV